MKFPTSKLATTLLTGMKGIEIGGSAHNPFGLDTINVDISDDLNNVFKKREIELCGQALPVDVVASGDKLPFEDKSFDFVISSHVIEHFYNPLAALREWHRVAREYIFIICPHVDRTTDKGKPLTTIADLEYNDTHPIENPEYRHWTIWNADNFKEMIEYLGMKIHTIQDPDDKVGNGFTVVIKIN